MARQFTEMIFLGDCAYSELRMRQLTNRLQEGLLILSALQQTSQGAVEDWEETNELRSELNDIVEDITCALGGCEKWAN